MSDDDGGSDGVETFEGELLSREERIEVFGEEFVEHQDWASDERERVEDVQDEVLQCIADRDDARIMKHGRSISNTGDHQVTFTVRVAGNPWEGILESDESDVE